VGSPDCGPRGFDDELICRLVAQNCDFVGDSRHNLGIFSVDKRERDSQSSYSTDSADYGLTGVFHSLVGRDSGPRTLAGRTSCEEDGKQMSDLLCLSRLQVPGRDTATPQFVNGRDGLKKMSWGAELIKANWLLSVSMLDKTRDWAATNVGQDVFLKLRSEPDERLLNDLEALKAPRARIMTKPA
jgi:hypothetical protein